MLPLVVHQPASPASFSIHLASSAVTPAGPVHKSRKGRFVCSELGTGATSEAGKSLFRAANVWWCAQYFVIASCG